MRSIVDHLVSNNTLAISIFSAIGGAALAAFAIGLLIGHFHH
jgi:hypothetical protein